jgi:hypothetical protein
MYWLEAVEVEPLEDQLHKQIAQAVAKEKMAVLEEALALYHSD